MIKYIALMFLFLGMVLPSAHATDVMGILAGQEPAPFTSWEQYVPKNSPAIDLAKALENPLKAGELPAHIRQFLLENSHVLPETYVVEPLNVTNEKSILSDSPFYLTGFQKMKKLEMSPSSSSSSVLVAPSTTSPKISDLASLQMLGKNKNTVQIKKTDATASKGKKGEKQKTNQENALLHDPELVEAREKSVYLETKFLAEQGDIKAQNLLGMLYFEGNGTPKNLKQALFWTQKAVDAEYSPAYLNMGIMEEKGIHAIQDVPNTNGVQNVDNAQKAAVWYEKAAHAQNAEGSYRLAVLYDTARLEQDTKKAKQKAIEYYGIASELEHGKASYKLAHMYERGEYIQKNMEVAVAYYRRAATLGNAISQMQMGAMYEGGKYFSIDSSLAAAWYSKAALQNLAPAQYLLAGMYRKGIGVPQNSNNALELYTLSARQGFMDAQFDLGIFYLMTPLVKEDRMNKENGIKWLEAASAQGDEQAKNILLDLKTKGKK